MMFVVSGLWSIVAFIVSVLLHPIMYTDDSTPFSRLRAAPAIGTALALVATFTNLELLRVKGIQESEGNFLAIVAAFVSIGTGVIAADFWRSIRED